MVREDLRDLPDVSLPRGFRIRPFQPGDERHWAEIEMRAGEFTSRETALRYFGTEFGADPHKLRERMLFLESESDGPIGTTSAWLGELQDRSMGRIHWVAIVPEFHGRGLSKPLLGAAMQVLACYHDSAFLTTQTSSWRAAGLYLRFGFKPLLETPKAERAWEIVRDKLATARR
jgi:ribosomal protein S18 acetylase RimI-like enzyme